jgi:hypothetical protein
VVEEEQPLPRFRSLRASLTVAPRSFSAEPELRSRGKYWRHAYTFSTYVLKVN